MAAIGEESLLATALDQQIVRLESIAPHRDEKEQRSQHTQMASNVRAHAQTGALPAQAWRQRIENHDKNRHADDQQHRPDIGSLLEGKPGGVEGEIVLEVWVALAKSHTKACQR